MSGYFYKILQKLLVIVMASAVSAVFPGPTVTLHFKDSAQVNDTLVYVRDIASVSATGGVDVNDLLNTAAGKSAPPGYFRFIGTAEVVQYRLRTRFPHLVFASDGTGRIPVRTSCVVKKIGDYDDDIASILRERLAWKGSEWTLCIENPEASWKCFNAPLEISVDGLQGDRPKGHLKLQLTVKQFGRTQRIPLLCRIAVVTQVAVARSDIPKGTVLKAADLEMRATDISAFAPLPFYSPGTLVGKKAARTIPAGSVMHDRLVVALPEIARGDPVFIELSKGNVRVSVAAIARENGFRGKKMWVENAANHRLVRVVVKDRNTVTLL